MSEVIKVGMADLNVCKAPDVITTLGLGSCIGLFFMIRYQKLGEWFIICSRTVDRSEITVISQSLQIRGLTNYYVG